MTKRLIEEWLPIAEIGIESVRERTPMTPFPAPNRLHVWWARRPLVASRAAVLASLLPADADRKTFMHMLGIHGDPVAARKRIAKATREGVRLGADAYGYSRAFSYSPNEKERFWLLEQVHELGIEQPSVIDPTAGGGAIPFEAMRLGCRTYANDINPVAVLVEKATFEWPARFGSALVDEVHRLGAELSRRVKERLGLTYGRRILWCTSRREVSRGRDITWTLRAMPPPEWVVEHWPGSATVIAVRSHGIREGKPTDETRYYVTSLRTSARSLLQHVRDRWSIENSWHWVRDVPLREDAHRYREPNGVQILATLRSLAINALRLKGIRSITEGIAALAHDIRGLLKLLGWREGAAEKPLE